MSNIANSSHSKKRAKKAVNEVLFDEDARREFLTGFHKRKVAKADAARKKAIERERQQRLETRREQRQELRQRAVENAAQVERAYGAADDSEDDEWEGISTKVAEEEYEDEEMVATVVVEDFDAETLIHGSTETGTRPVQPSVSTIREPKTPNPKKQPRPKRFGTKRRMLARPSEQRTGAQE
ncbi:nucleolar protein 12-domain-containing protein [Mycena amicta]|nr:nucleolar protein 12-domain-containing protein [Mycena amicta]